MAGCASINKADVGLGDTENGAQINVIEEIQKNGTALSVQNKVVNITLGKSDVGLGNVDNTSDSAKASTTGNPIHDAIDERVSKNQGSEHAGLYLAVGDDGYVMLKEGGGPGPVTKKVYTFRIPYGSLSSNIEYLEDAIGLSEQDRRSIVRSWAKHAVVKNGVVQYWLDETNLNIIETNIFKCKGKPHDK